MRSPIPNAVLLCLMFCAACCTSATVFADTPAEGKPGRPTVAITTRMVELPQVLREVAGNGKASPVTHALVDIAYPPGFDASRAWPVLVINATSDLRSNSSRALMRRYADTATAAGWVVVAADANRVLVVNQDNVKLRLALVSAALAVLQLEWPAAADSPLAFGGFSGGAKHSGWLAAAFVAQDRKVIGVFQAGINEESFVKAGKQFEVNNAAFLRIPVFLLVGDRDRMSSPNAHRRVEKQLKKGGAQNVRLEIIEGPHYVDPKPLKGALEWFAELAAQPSM